MPSSRRERSQSGSSSKSGHSRAERASGSMGKDGGEAGRRAAEEEEYIRRELADQSSFCNAFWGSGDSGYEVIQARMKIASRTLDELKFLLKERSEIELEYSKKLSKLSKISLGKEEIGSMKNALDTIRNELEVSARSHAELAGVMKGGLETSVADFQNRVNNGRKQQVALITSLHKQKQTQEAYVAKARDKYEQDCIKINGYTAQSSLVQGRDLDKVTGKLDKAQSTVASNDKDYQNFTRALKDTSGKWITEWKSYLDQCQDTEEDRLDFMKTKSWDYANAVSAVCVADDESSERVRVALENCETSRDIEMFIQYAGTGPAIPDPPEYINYAKGQPPPARPSFRTANFQRNSNRPRQPPPSAGPPPGQGGAQSSPQAPVAPLQQQKPDERAHQNFSGGSQSGSQAPRPRPPSDEQDNSTSNFKPPPGAVGLPGMSTSPANMSPSKTERALPRQSEYGMEASSLPPSRSQPQSHSGATPERRMSARNFISRTPSMSRGGAQGHTPKSTVDLGRGKMGVADSSSTLASQTPSTTSAAEQMDPIAKALADLRAARTTGRSPAPQSPSGNAPPPLSKSPAPGPQNHRQSSYRAPSPAGSHNAASRPRSPSAAFMAPPARAASPLPVEDVLGTYGQSFPGERRDISRQNSSSSRISSNHQASGSSMTISQHQPDRSRSPAPQGGSFAGVGAGNRSPSPQPYSHQQRQPQQQHRPQQGSQASNVPPRSTTPLGISLDARGSVTHDLMADEFVKRTGSVSPAISASQQQRGSTHQQQQYQSQNPSSPQRPQAQYAPSPSQSQPSHLHQAQPSSQHQQYASHQPSISSPYGAPQQVSSHQSQPSMASHYSASQFVTQQQQQSQHIQSPYGPTVQAVQPPPQSPAPYVQNGHQQSASVYSQHPAASASPAPLSTGAGYQGYSHPQQQHQQPQHSNHYSQSSSYSQVPPQQQPYGQAGGPSTPGAQPPGETAASAYMQQYRAQNAPPAPAQPVLQSQQRQSSYNAASQPPSQAYGGQVQHAPPQQHQQWQQQPAQPSNNQAQIANQQVHQQPPPQSNGQPHPPTGQFSDSVKALYDYSATMDEEFSFTAGDIIAVTHTEADGWWQGELLDEARRRPGSNTFPSNFVVLLM